MADKTYVDDGAGLAILEAHVLGSSTDDAERSAVMDIEHELELLIGRLVKHCVKSESCVVDNDVDLAEGPVKRKR